MSVLSGGAIILFVVTVVWNLRTGREKQPVRIAVRTDRQGYAAHHMRR